MTDQANNQDQGAAKPADKPATAKSAPKKERHAVVFLKRWNRYFPGDIAGFDKETTDKLVGAKVVKLHK